MSVLDEIATLLQTAGVGTIGTDLFKGRAQDTPDVQTVVREYGGEKPVYTHDSAGVATERPRVQVSCRGIPEDYAGPSAAARTAWLAFNATAGNSTIGGTRYLKARPLQSPFLLDRDANGRLWIGFNLEIEKTVS